LPIGRCSVCTTLWLDQKPQGVTGRHACIVAHWPDTEDGGENGGFAKGSREVCPIAGDPINLKIYEPVERNRGTALALDAHAMRAHIARDDRSHPRIALGVFPQDLPGNGYGMTILGSLLIPAAAYQAKTLFHVLWSSKSQCA
jgi:hypothetical protein